VSYWNKYPPQLPESSNERLPVPSPAVEAGFLRDVEESESPLAEYLEIIRQNKLKVLAFTLAGLLVGLGVILWRPVLYSASSTLELLAIDENFLNMNNADPRRGVYSADQANIQTQLLVMQSNWLRGQVLNDMLQDASLPVPPRHGIIYAVRNAAGLEAEDDDTARRQAIYLAAGSLSAVPLRNSRVIAVRSNSTSPEIAAEYVNRLTGRYAEYSVADRYDHSRRTAEWIRDEREKVKNKLEQAEQRLQTYVRHSGLVLVGDQQEVPQTLASAKLRQLQTELARLEGERIAKEARYRRATQDPTRALPSELDDGSLLSYRTRLTDLRRQRAELASYLKPAHYRVERLQAQIDEMKAAMLQEQQEIVRRIKDEYEFTSQRERMLVAAYEARSREVTSQAVKGIQYNILKRQMDSYRDLYNAMLQHSNEATIAAAVPANSVRVVDRASPAGRPFQPRTTSVLATSLFGGLLFGCVVLVLGEKLNRTLRQPGDTSRLLSVPELGVIPANSAASWKPHRPRRGRSSGLSILSRNTNGNTAAGGAQVDLEIWQPDNPSTMAEAFRTVLSSLMFSHDLKRPPEAVVITSPHPRDGKTTVASNLALAMAEANRRTLLIDADLRRPSLHAVFGVADGKGLVSLLGGKRPILDYEMSTIIRPTAFPNLFVMPAGLTNGAGVNSMLYSPRAAELLARLRGEFDIVLLDSPPLLQFADAMLLGRITDGAILVLRSGNTDRAAALATHQRLCESGVRILGTILNDFRPRGPGAAYYYSKRYYRH